MGHCTGDRFFVFICFHLFPFGVSIEHGVGRIFLYRAIAAITDYYELLYHHHYYYYYYCMHGPSVSSTEMSMLCLCRYEPCIEHFFGNEIQLITVEMIFDLAPE